MILIDRCVFRFAKNGGSRRENEIFHVINALLRAYIWHCIAIPLIAATLMIVHFWRIRKDGAISGPAPVMLASELKPPKKK